MLVSRLYCKVLIFHGLYSLQINGKNISRGKYFHDMMNEPRWHSITPPIKPCWPRPSTCGTTAGKDWPMTEATEGRLFVDSVVRGFAEGCGACGRDIIFRWKKFCKCWLIDKIREIYGPRNISALRYHFQFTGYKNYNESHWMQVFNESWVNANVV